MAGKTVEDATERALDQLGVAVGDAEVIVLSEPKSGLFGRMRGEARVRARVRPVGARPRRERSRRTNKSGQGGREGRQQGGQGGQRSRSGGASAERETAAAGGNGSGGSGTTTAAGAAGAAGTAAGAGTSRSARRRRNRSKSAGGTGSREGSRNGSSAGPSAERAPQRSSEPTKETEDMAEGMTLEEQGEIGRAFVAGLLTEFGMEGDVELRLLDEDTVEIAAIGEDLGILVGPRGSTLAALQDVTRAVVQRQCPSRTDRILVDVAGYRERRSAALKRFSVQIAEEVLASGQEKALEAMSPADRKAVHDAVNEMDGVVTRSEGEDPNRHIVIAPGG